MNHRHLGVASSALTLCVIGFACTEAAPAEAPHAATAEKSAPVEAHVATPPPQSPADSNALGVLAPTQVPSMDERFADKYARRDSKLDGWDTELFNERAGKQLSALGKLIAHPSDLDVAHLAPLVESSIECVDLRPESAPVATSTQLVQVARNDQPASVVAQRGAEGTLVALHELADAFEGASDVVAKFKIVGVEPSADFVVTRCYLQVKGRPASGARQFNATWLCKWTPLPSAPADALPKLLRIDVVEHAEAVLPGSGAPMYAEATEAVLGAQTSFREQLAPSLESWCARTDVGLGIALIGHEGVALADVDGDLLDDVYVPQPGGLPNRLYVRQKDGTALDTSHEAGVDFLDASRSALFVDFDNDGDQDLAVELDPTILLLANDGHGHFEVRCEARAPSTTSMSAVDYDGDGDLDVYCCGYIIPDQANVTPLPYNDANNGRPNTMLRNDSVGAAWKFTDVTHAIGLDENNRRFSFACSWEDYDGDGDQDLYVANDFGRANLYRNDGGHFDDVAAEAGVENMAAGMGVTWADFDLDGKPDLYVSNMFSSAGERVTYQRKFMPTASPETVRSFQHHARGNTLFKNLGDGTFADVSEEARVTMGRWAWGAIFTDFDDDGLSDLFVPNGFVTGEDPEDL